ncbi:MAG: SurA N-terminal domain-containing protein [Candidatus Paceibacterota bacterium]
MSNQRRLIISIGLVVAIVAGGWFALSFLGESSSNNQEVVATVNGESIYQKELDGQVERLEQQMSAQPGAQVDQGQLEQQALDQMISTVLVKQEADKQGIEVSDKEIKKEIENLKETLGEDTSYEKQLEAAGLTKEEHEEMLREQLLTNKYLQEQVPQDEVEVTDKQMQEAYKQISSQQDLPPLEEMEESMKKQLRSQVAQQQRSQLIQDLIKSLREKAEIESSL